MALPAGLDTVVVTVDAPLHPNGTARVGSIKFTPAPKALISATEDAIIAGPAVVAFDGSGTEQTIELLATDAAGVLPSGWTYRVEEKWNNAPSRSYAIALPAANPAVNLADIAPTDPAAGELPSASSFGQELVSSADAPAARTALGLGTAAAEDSSAFDAAGSAAAAQAAAIEAAVASPRVARIAPDAYPAGRVALYIGESTITGAGSTSNSQYGIQAILPQYVGNARIARYGTSINGAADGRTVADVLSDLDALLDANPQVGIVLCNVGTNDASQGTTVADFAARYVQVIEMIVARGIPFVATTATPRTSAAPAIASLTARYNAWLTDYCHRKRIPLADWHAALVDPATGYIRSTLVAGDNVHPNDAGHQALAAVAKPVVESLIPLPSWLPSYGPQANGLLANPLMSGGTGSTLPTGWFINPSSPPTTFGRGTEDPVTGDGLPAGKWFFLELDNTAGGSAVFCEMRHSYISSGISPGDVLRIYAHVKADPASQFEKVGFRIRSATTVLATPWYRLVTAAPGPIVMDYTIGATVANFNVGLEVTADAGRRARAAIGAVQVYNLTTGGLVGLP